jgi:hypothetical protein
MRREKIIGLLWNIESWYYTTLSDYIITQVQSEDYFFELAGEGRRGEMEDGTGRTFAGQLNNIQNCLFGC